MPMEPRERLRRAHEPIDRLAVQVRAVHAVFDELLAEPLALLPFASAASSRRTRTTADRLLAIAFEMEDDLRELHELRDIEVRQAADWRKRAEIAIAKGATRAGEQARVREREHREAGDALSEEVRKLEDEHRECLSAVSRVAGLASLGASTRV